MCVTMQTFLGVNVESAYLVFLKIVGLRYNGKNSQFNKVMVEI